MKVGDLVKYSQDWRNENLYYEEEALDRYGIGIIITKSSNAWRGGTFHITWSSDNWASWEHERDLEIISESR